MRICDTSFGTTLVKHVKKFFQSSVAVSIKFYINIQTSIITKFSYLQHALLKEVFSSSRKESKLCTSGSL